MHISYDLTIPFLHMVTVYIYLDKIYKYDSNIVCSKNGVYSINRILYNNKGESIIAIYNTRDES